MRTSLSSRVNFSPINSISEKALFKLLSVELQYLLECVNILQKLRTRYDYDLLTLFRALDQNNAG